MTQERTEGKAPLLPRLAEAAYRHVFQLVSVVGLPPWFIVTLETRGRRSGRVHAAVVILTAWAGERYAVSVLGDGSDWVQNVRAAGGQATIRHGGRRDVRLSEVPEDQRAPILKAYLKWALGARRIFNVSHTAPVDEFEHIAANHPVFRIIDDPA